MRRFSFFISCENYKNYSPTPYCHADAELLKKTLIEKCDYQDENSLSYRLSPGDEIDKKTIIDGVTDLIGRASDGDSILFFFAGHGLSKDKETYLVLPNTSPFDEVNTALKLSDINYYLSKNKRLNIRIFDCCHSGEGSRDATLDLAEQEFVESVLKNGSDCSITLASCAAHEKSYPDDAVGQGIFTYSLVNAINASPEGSAIFAETLKISVCNAVKSWCDERGKTQTPTSNIQISGNIPIAYRQKARTEAKLAERTDLPLKDRLQAARMIEVINEKFYPELTEGLKFITNELETCLTPEKLFGQNLQKTSSKGSGEIPTFLKEKILNRMKSQRTMHTMEVEREELPQIKSVFSSIYEHKPQYRTNYFISQKLDMPESFQTLESKTDGYLPSSGVFVYVCPLQVTVTILMGYYFDKSYNEAKSEINVQKISQQTYSMADFKSRHFTEQIAAIEKSYEFDLGVEIKNRITNLENEINTLKG